VYSSKESALHLKKKHGKDEGFQVPAEPELKFLNNLWGIGTE
jgi:hypothetical protein